MTVTSGRTTSTPERSWTASSMEERVLPALHALFESLLRAGVRYCHWKSNWRLSETLRGETDLDLLVHRADVSRFLSVVGLLGYKPGRDRSGTSPSVRHFYGLDD